MSVSFAAGLISSVVIRVATWALLWAVLTEGDIRDPWLAAVVVLLTVASSYVVQPYHGWKLVSPIGIVHFLLYFLWESFRGGIDVSLRALRPSLPLTLGFHIVELDLPPGGLRVLYLWVISLIPGTASVKLDGDAAVVHVIIESDTVDDELKKLQKILSGLN